ncbi:type I pullulanase [Bacillus sp. FJAT-29814]|uniref:type I pullulanase n=1 Tax=Bacillus sp. FJAT-29814 TaxID=1729688 RepID=UPI000834FF46|nr:type I pullulanase [Bacillus sp. FJAT-29814]
MISADRIFLAYLDDMNIITVLLPFSYHHGESSSFCIMGDDEKQPLKIIKSLPIENYQKYICELSSKFSFEKQYWIFDEHGGKTDLQIGAVIRTEAFDQQFFYDGEDLGVTYKKEETQFRLWAPTALKVKLKLRKPSSHHSEIIKMKREERGVWAISVKGDLELSQYSYLVQVNREWREAVDPYTKAVTANGELGVIVNFEKTNRAKIPLPPLEDAVDAIIYETHLRDFTIHCDSGVVHKGLYLGAGELNTTEKNGKSTGLSYVKELGITHVQFLPFHDFAGVNELADKNEYNWGYNPLHFNAPEGSYSTDPSNPYSRITELKQLIDQLHHAGLRMIMDVVYNHVYIRENSPFEKIVPGYYFRHNELGLPSNGTGVGNDIASERRMVRKFITDSIRFWVEEYHIDGFRFDLMGILDVETMNEVRSVCDGLAEDTLIIGEGWNLNTPLPLEQKAIIQNQSQLPKIGQFNDKFRDSIKGSTFNMYDKGYALGNRHYFTAALEAITGSIGFKKKGTGLFNEPSQSVNYVECHDNHTLWDKLQACLPNADDEKRKKYHRLATGLVLLSQGIPFIHSGQEFFRTKQGEGNSYRSPDSVNQLDWERRSFYEETVEYVKGLIQIRKQYPCFRMRTGEEIRSRIGLLPVEVPIIGLLFHSESPAMILLINPSSATQKVVLPAGSWGVLADGNRAGLTRECVIDSGEIELAPITLNVLVKK